MLLYEGKHKSGQSDASGFSPLYLFHPFFSHFFTNLLFHFLKWAEIYSWEKCLRCRSAPLQEWSKMGTFCQRRNPVSVFVFGIQAFSGQYPPFVVSSGLWQHLHWGWLRPSFHWLQQQHQLKLFLPTFVPPPLIFCPCTAPSVRGA